MATKEASFIDEAIKILVSLGYLVDGYSDYDVENIMRQLGYKKGYNGVWISPGDIIPDEQ